jgi:hypothetical protein
MGLVAVDMHQPLVRQGAQPADIAAAVLVEEVGAELVDADHHHQLRNRPGVGGLRDAGDGEDGKAGEGAGPVAKRHGPT